MNSIIGKRFGRLTVVARSDIRTKSGEVKYECLCDCGNTHYATSANLKKGSVKSCGCLQRESGTKNGKATAKDLTGQKFGRLTVVRRTDEKYGTNYLWKCKCECGNTTYVPTASLTRGSTRSCGCITVEKSRAECQDKFKIRDGTNISVISKNTISSNNTSGVRGVSLRKDGKYVAYIDFQKKRYTLGRFRTLQEAAEARRKAEQRYFGEYLEAHNKKGQNEQ